MPPFSKELWEEGAQVKSFKLVKKGQFDEAGVVKILSEEPAQYPGCSGTRTLSDVSVKSSCSPGRRTDGRTYRIFTRKSQHATAALSCSMR